ncbi:hypothetical protein [Crocosphaera chwakensis]|uniref:Uncharacterized protein n=1 Tax=Crocosphaera chwakensis CCY0110 TaxID=391612 RepID=A3IKG8_9CHRO|nr:hypothetical protein [Crocosphaera chwakensis]EAZ93157.1 hypothetical protein CY0110_03774 [Crocosphaera chwakensis CCY0110]
MWRVNVHCNGDAWKQSGADFKTMTENYQLELIGSQKMPDETRIMAYKMDDISEVETFIEDCTKFSGFTADFESL